MLAGIIATIIQLHYADMIGVKGRLRQVFGWIVILFSDLAFAEVAVLETKRLFVDELSQQALVDAVMLLTDISLAVVLATLGVLMFWRLVDLFRPKGCWDRELKEADLVPGEPTSGDRLGEEAAR